MISECPFLLYLHSRVCAVCMRYVCVCVCVCACLSRQFYGSVLHLSCIPFFLSCSFASSTYILLVAFLRQVCLCVYVCVCVRTCMRVPCLPTIITPMAMPLYQYRILPIS